jgi:ATP-dependent protease ClpP protease subunit
MSRLDTLVALAGRAQTVRPGAHGSRRWFNVQNAASDTIVHVYDAIGGYDGVNALEFVQQINDVNSKSITLHVNSPGGDVFDAIAMHAALKNHPASVNVVVDGVAASAASFLAMAGDTIAIEKPARIMIHDASGLTIGNEEDHREMADLLGQISDTIAGMYADRAGGDVKTWRAAMRTESWYTAPQAVEAGLADRVLNDNAPAPQDRRSQLIRARASARTALKG